MRSGISKMWIILRSLVTDYVTRRMHSDRSM